MLGDAMLLFGGVALQLGDVAPLGGVVLLLLGLCYTSPSSTRDGCTDATRVLTNTTRRVAVEQGLRGPFVWE